MNEIKFDEKTIWIDGAKAIGPLASGWVIVQKPAPVLVFEIRGRRYENAILEYSVDGGYGQEERAVALSELSATESSNRDIIKAANDFASKRIGFAEFKRVIRDGYGK